jgi:hypothetical protein
MNVVPITKESHATKKIKRIESYAFAANYNLASVMVHEFSKAAVNYPVVFIENKQNDGFRPVALLGFSEGENLFVDEDGKWNASYIPAIIRRYPFALAPTQKEGRFTVCIDESSDAVNDEEGQDMFDKNGEPTKLMEQVKRYLAGLHQMEMVTGQFCKTLAEKNLFMPLTMRFRDDKTIRNVGGAYVVNEKRLNSLSDEEFLALRKDNFLQPIYSHLISLAQVRQLNILKSKRLGETVQEQVAPQLDADEDPKAAAEE